MEVIDSKTINNLEYTCSSALEALCVINGILKEKALFTSLGIKVSDDVSRTRVWLPAPQEMTEDEWKRFLFDEYAITDVNKAKKLFFYCEQFIAFYEPGEKSLKIFYK